MLDRDQVANVVRLMLGREPRHLSFWMEKGSIEEVIRALSSYKEFIDRIRSTANKKNEDIKFSHFIQFRDYATPQELSRSEPLRKKIRIIGTCLVSDWPDVLKTYYPDCEADFILLNNLAMAPKMTPEESNKYAFQIINIPTRFIFNDNDIIRAVYLDERERNRILQSAKLRIDQFINNSFKENEQLSIETYFTNFLIPHREPLGRLPQIGALRVLYNDLNDYLLQRVRQLNNSFILDIDCLANIFGKRFLLDDPVWLTSHGGFLNDFDHSRDQGRLEPPPSMLKLYENRWREFVASVWDELFAMHKTLSQEEMVKLVITDLDDTLWRGVVGEQEAPSTDLEGWPLGYLEALLVLKKRGVLLAIVSKNTEEIITRNWSRLTRDKIMLSDFVCVKVNWKTKVENIKEILSEVHLTSANAVFIDDNPVERASVLSAFPDLRVLGANPYTIKRNLLWSAEAQVSHITAESASRTEMLQAASQRLEDMKSMSREEFLESLDVKIVISVIKSANDPKFARCRELINKTNQFNTTGHRWAMSEFSDLFNQNGTLFCFDVCDRFVDYGLVGVLIVNGGIITQFVMSCRVIGLDVEIAALRCILAYARDSGAPISLAQLIETEKNLACRDVYSRAGLTLADTGWIVPDTLAFDTPKHVKINWSPVKNVQPIDVAW